MVVAIEARHGDSMCRLGFASLSSELDNAFYYLNIILYCGTSVKKNLKKKCQ